MASLETVLRAKRAAGNIGCGKVLFPTDEQRAADPDCEWLNIDHLVLPGIDLQMDAFVYPWPLPDAFLDHLHLSHLCEHIPHESRIRRPISVASINYDADQQLLARPSPVDPSRSYSEHLAQLDGFFAFFAECWRVLKPGGTIFVEVPHGHSIGALMDPTHTRYILPATVSYLTVQGSATFDYLLPFRFACDSVQFFVHERYAQLSEEEIREAANHQVNVIVNFQFTLRKLPLDAGAGMNGEADVQIGRLTTR